jgi:hypothetical protein
MRRVCFAENFETLEAIAGLGHQRLDIPAASDVVTDHGLTDVVEVHMVDGHKHQLVGFLVEVAKKEEILHQLATCGEGELRERSERAPELKLAIAARFALRGIAVAGWSIVLGVLGNAVYQFVVIPLITAFTETHDERMTGSTRVNRQIMLTSFPVLQFLSLGSMIDLFELSNRCGLKTWDVMIQLNLLQAKGIVAGSVKSGFSLTREADAGMLTFGESGFHLDRKELVSPVRIHDDVLAGLTVSR